MIFEVTKKVTFTWYVECDTKEEAVEWAIELGEGKAHTDGTEHRARRVSPCRLHEPMNPLPPLPKKTNKWCECEKDEFWCYPEDGECSCGTYKHHTHCKKCGGVSQIG